VVSCEQTDHVRGNYVRFFFSPLFVDGYRLKGEYRNVRARTRTRMHLASKPLLGGRIDRLERTTVFFYVRKQFCRLFVI